MQEGIKGVKRLLGAIERNVDDTNISLLATILNYHEAQLKNDIEAIRIAEEQIDYIVNLIIENH